MRVLRQSGHRLGSLSPRRSVPSSSTSSKLPSSALLDQRDIRNVSLAPRFSAVTRGFAGFVGTGTQLKQGVDHMRVVDLTIEDIAFGGKGVGREKGKAVF